MAAREQSQQKKLSLSQRRKSSQGLDPLQMPPDVNYDVIAMEGMNTDQEIVEEGRELFQNFVVEEIERESPDDLTDVALSTPQGYKNPLWAKTGRDLRLLADEFAQTKERQRVRQRALNVQINITYEEFKDMLTELFLGDGITNERIVVLFYFCSDITIRSLRAGVEQFRQFMSWCTRFIIEKVCWWVQIQGGWSQVVKKPFNSTYKMAAWVAAFAVVLLFVGYRHWRS